MAKKNNLAYRCLKDHKDGKINYYLSELVWFNIKSKLPKNLWERKPKFDRKNK